MYKFIKKSQYRHILHLNKKNNYFSDGKIYPSTMRSRLYAVLSIILFGILYCYTAIGVFIILILALLKLKGPIRVITQLWAKSVFIIMGKRFRVQGKEYIDKIKGIFWLPTMAVSLILWRLHQSIPEYPGLDMNGSLKFPCSGRYCK